MVSSVGAAQKKVKKKTGTRARATIQLRQGALPSARAGDTNTAASKTEATIKGQNKEKKRGAIFTKTTGRARPRSHRQPRLI